MAKLNPWGKLLNGTFGENTKILASLNDTQRDIVNHFPKNHGEALVYLKSLKPRNNDIKAEDDYIEYHRDILTALRVLEYETLDTPDLTSLSSVQPETVAKKIINRIVHDAGRKPLELFNYLEKYVPLYEKAATQNTATRTKKNTAQKQKNIKTNPQTSLQAGFVRITPEPPLKKETKVIKSKRPKNAFQQIIGGLSKIFSKNAQKTKAQPNTPVTFNNAENTVKINQNVETLFKQFKSQSIEKTLAWVKQYGKSYGNINEEGKKSFVRKFEPYEVAEALDKCGLYTMMGYGINSGPTYDYDVDPLFKSDTTRYRAFEYAFRKGLRLTESLDRNITSEKLNLSRAIVQAAAKNGAKAAVKAKTKKPQNNNKLVILAQLFKTGTHEERARFLDLHVDSIGKVNYKGHNYSRKELFQAWKMAGLVSSGPMNPYSGFSTNFSLQTLVSNAIFADSLNHGDCFFKTLQRSVRDYKESIKKSKNISKMIKNYKKEVEALEVRTKDIKAELKKENRKAEEETLAAFERTEDRHNIKPLDISALHSNHPDYGENPFEHFAHRTRGLSASEEFERAQETKQNQDQDIMDEARRYANDIMGSKEHFPENNITDLLIAA